MTGEEHRARCQALRGGMTESEAAIIADLEAAESFAREMQEQAKKAGDAVDEAAKREATLARYVKLRAICPGCETEARCVPDCTYQDDDEVGWTDMQMARAALAESKEGKTI